MSIINLDKERNLKYTWYALELLEERAGISLLALFSDEKSIQALTQSPKKFRHIIWAGLVHEDKNLKPEDLIPYLHIKDAPVLIRTVVESFIRDMGVNKE